MRDKVGSRRAAQFLSSSASRRRRLRRELRSVKPQQHWKLQERLHQCADKDDSTRKDAQLEEEGAKRRLDHAD